MAVCSIFPFYVDSSSQSVNLDPDEVIYGCSSLSSHVRFWDPCGRRDDPFRSGRADRQLGTSLSCVLCSASLGDLTHCLSVCPAFADLREE